MRVYMEVSLRMGVIVRVLVQLCVYEIEFGCEMEGDCVEVRESVTGSVLKCESECLRECRSNVCTILFEPFKIVPGLAESSPVVEENI